MARVTVEDCEKIVPNRFDLVILAAQRTRQLNAGEPVTISGTEDEKRPVVALREIAAQTVSADGLKERVINSYRTFMPESDEDDGIDEIVEEDTYDPYASLGIIEDASADVVEESQEDENQNDGDMSSDDEGVLLDSEIDDESDEEVPSDIEE